MDIHDYLRPLYRRRWLAGAVWSVSVVLAVVYAFTATPAYRATARLLVEAEDPNVVTFQQVVRGKSDFGRDLQTTQRDMLRSRHLARATIDSLGLWNHPEFGGDGGGEERSWSSNAIRAVRRAWESLRSAVSPPSPAVSPPLVADDGAVDAETPAESRAISTLLDRLRVVGGRDSRVIRLHFESGEPRLAADVVNTLARLHVERDMEFRYTSSRNASLWLQQRIAEQRQRLEESERALQSYREEHGAAAVEDRQTIIVRELENLHAAVTSATMRRAESEARYRDLQAARDDPEALGRFPEILHNEVIQDQRLALANLRRERARLSEELGPRHPDMISIETSLRDAETRLQQEVLAVVDSLRIGFQVASTQEDQLQAELDKQTQEALALDRTGIEYSVMRREAESNRRLYESLLQRAAETGVTGELETSNIRVLDAAVIPVRRFRPQRQFILLVGLLGGGFLAVGLVFLLDQLDDAIRSPEEIREHLATPYLGMVPLAKIKSGKDDRGRNGLGLRDKRDKVPATQLLVSGGAPVDFEEAIRSVRTSLIFSSADEGCRTVLVTSTAPGEGKSCLSANLAVALAQMGLRTLLVDADLRRPQLHSYFGVNLEPGLSNFLVAQAPMSAAIAGTTTPGLSLVPAGKIPPNPTDLLGSRRFADWLESCRSDFDWILLDTTPVLPVADALVAAPVAASALFVISTGKTSRRAAGQALRELGRTKVHLLGAVLNKAALERHPYYYSPYYRREYGRYYQRAAS